MFTMTHLRRTSAAASIFLASALSAHAQPLASPCALLSTEQIKSVLGTPVLAGKLGGGGAECTWADPQSGATRVYLKLSDAGPEYKSFRDSMQSTGRLVPVTGLAEDAFFVSATGASAALYTLKSHHLLLLTVDGVGFSKAQNEAAERALAGRALPKL
jgi:hypothetical protein